MTDMLTMLWFDAVAMTALLIAAVLLLRRPVAALFGARVAYALWLIPLLRLVLPPLPGGVTVIDSGPAAPEIALEIGAPVPGPEPTASVLDIAVLVDALPFVWLAGAVGVLALALYRHRLWLRDVLAEATPLEPIGRVRLVMSGAVDGPVATGLVRQLVAVPTDFFARYNQAERALAIEHELAHHRAGDLWANAAALLVLAAQWFNPFAWWALGAFRFDQEAACDARILGAVAAPERPAQAHHYARAIAKSLAGPRLLLAAPMTSGREVKERLQMLTKEPQGGLRPVLGRMLLGGGAVAALALTISTLPNKVVFAAEPAADAPAAPAEKRVKRTVIVTTDDADDETSADGVKREVRSVVIRDGEWAEGKPRKMIINGEEIELPDGAAIAREVQNAMPFFGLDEDELRAALAEQGIKGAKADAVVKRLQEKRGEALRKQFSWAEDQAKRAEADAAQAEAAAARAGAGADRARAAAERHRVFAVALQPANTGFPMTEATYAKVRDASAEWASEREMLELTLHSLRAARANVANADGDTGGHDEEVLKALDREIGHLKAKMRRL